MKVAKVAELRNGEGMKAGRGIEAEEEERRDIAEMVEVR
jgi:hypothetical protein